MKVQANHISFKILVLISKVSYACILVFSVSYLLILSWSVNNWRIFKMTLTQFYLWKPRVPGINEPLWHNQWAISYGPYDDFLKLIDRCTEQPKDLYNLIVRIISIRSLAQKWIIWRNQRTWWWLNIHLFSRMIVVMNSWGMNSWGFSAGCRSIVKMVLVLVLALVVELQSEHFNPLWWSLILCFGCFTKVDFLISDHFIEAAWSRKLGSKLAN